ncbi:MAG: thioredoxin family protein [Alphaproteobacteria bacterium]|nr:MAG: thioredoxin family protein [Alphaproteobacteria bacterium]
MTRKATFYHAGCAVCISAEQGLAQALDPANLTVEIVHLGQDRSRIAEAEAAGVVSVPALVIDDQAFHINFGASLADVRGAA